jgi:HEPN domain-containing protein
MPKIAKSIVEKAAIKYAEKVFDDKFKNITRDEVKADFQNCVKDFLQGHYYAERNRFCKCRKESPVYVAKIVTCRKCNKIVWR